MRSNGVVQDLRAAARRRRADPVPDRRATRTTPTRSTCCATRARTCSPRRCAGSIPGVKIAIGPPIEQRLLLRLRVPRADHRGRPRADRGGGPARARRGPRVDARGDLPPTRRASASRPRASRTRSSSSTRPRARSASTRSRTTERRVHRPLPRPAPPGLGADQGVQADRPRRRLLARRRAEQAADPDLRHGVLLAGRPRRAPRAARGGAHARPPPARRRSSTSSTSPTSRPARRSGTRRGWRSGTCSRTCAAARTPRAATSRCARRRSTTRSSG